MDRVTEDRIRRRICDLITKNPGIHLSKLSELLNMPITSLDQELKYLIKNKIINCKVEEGYKRYHCEVGGHGYLAQTLQENQRQIYDLILKNPGLHLSKIARMLSMRKSLAEYHLNILERAEIITTIKEMGYKRYFVGEEDVDSKDRQVLSIVRQKVPFKIVTLLLKNSVLKHKELVKLVDISPSTLSYHLSKLVKAGVVEVHRYGDDKGYRLKNISEVMRFLVKYEMDSAIESVKDLWEDIY